MGFRVSETFQIEEKKAIKWREITSQKWFFGMELFSMKISEKTDFFATVL